MFKLAERSLIDINGSLLVTLPITWVRNNTLRKGEKVSVALDEDSGALVIAPIGGGCDGMSGNPNAETTVQNTIDIVRPRRGEFVGTAIALGVTDLPFVDSGTRVLAIEKRRTKNALFLRITRSGAP